LKSAALDTWPSLSPTVFFQNLDEFILAEDDRQTSFEGEKEKELTS
jgi:hypothetical protein